MEDNSRKYLDFFNKKVSELDSLANINEGKDSTLFKLDAIKKKEQEEVERLEREKRNQTTKTGPPIGDSGEKFRAGLTGGGLFAEGSKGEAPMLGLAGGFLPVPNIEFFLDQKQSGQPAAYVERDELGYLSGGFESPSDKLSVALDILTKYPEEEKSWGQKALDASALAAEVLLLGPMTGWRRKK